jgi:tetraacyldisaccharide 4'-kinase
MYSVQNRYTDLRQVRYLSPMFRGKKWLKPLGLIYSALLRLRHALYNAGIIKSEIGKLPTIVIGNLALGGTGKTPHAEYILRQLRQWCKPALLSRGYGRNTRGFIWANRVKASASIIGDEPMQILLKFPDLDVAVCENRLRGVEYLKNLTNSNVVVLDDAFQHRKLQGDFNILLTCYSNPYWKDSVLPGGSLRDTKQSARRADAIIVTKCPNQLSQEAQDEVVKAIRPGKNQRVFFTRLKYGDAYPLTGKAAALPLGSKVIGLAGLADDSVFKQYLDSRFQPVYFESFADHHTFSPKEIEQVWSKYGTFAQAIVTTEKDAVRLRNITVPEGIPIFVIPITVAFLNNESAFVQLLRST